MSNAAFHLNLLRESERLSSSPVRVRVIMPTLAFLAAIGMGVWWGSVFTQELLVDMRLKSLRTENETRKTAEKEARDRHFDYLECSAELEQLDGYANSVRRLGPAFAKMAEAMPFSIQLISLSVEPPDPQTLKPAAPRQPPPRGPTNTVETQKFTIDGRTAKALYGNQLKKALLENPAFAPLVSSLTTERSSVDTSGQSKNESKATLFHLEYAMPPRSFAKAKEDAKAEEARK